MHKQECQAKAILFTNYCCKNMSLSTPISASYSGTHKTVDQEDDSETQVMISNSPMNVKHRSILLNKLIGKPQGNAIYNDNIKYNKGF